MEIEQGALAFAGLEALGLDPAAQPVAGERLDGRHGLPGGVRPRGGGNAEGALSCMGNRLVEGELAPGLPVGLRPSRGKAVRGFFEGSVRKNVLGRGGSGLR